MIAVGLDVGGTKILGVALADDGAVLGEERRMTVDRADALLDDLAELYGRLACDDAGRAPVGVGVPGLVDVTGRLVFAPNLLSVSGTDVRAGLAGRLAAPASGAATPPPVGVRDGGDGGPRGESGPVVVVDNDATCTAAGESALGAGRGRSDVLFVTLGTGIGGGIVAGGRIVHGASNFAGEIGHVVVDPHGPPCGCGRRGCWERYASGSGLGRIARDASHANRASRIVALAGGDADAVRGEHVIRALEEGDAEAATVVEEFAWWLALGLANFANVLDPAVIVIGGGLVRAGEALLEPVRRAFAAQLEGASLRPAIEIVPAALADRGGAIGAAVIALETAGRSLLGPGPAAG